MRGGRGYSRGGGATSYGRGGSSSSYRGGSSSTSSFRGGGSNYSSGQSRNAPGGGRYSGNGSYGNNNSSFESPRSSSRYEDNDRDRSSFKRPNYGNERDMDDRKRSRYEGGSRGGASGSSMRRGGGSDSGFRSSSSLAGRDFGNSGGGGNRYEPSSRNSNYVGRRSSPGYHSSHSHHNNSSSSNHHHQHHGARDYGSGRGSPGPSSFHSRTRESSGGRVRRDSDSMGPPKRMLPPPPPRIMGRGRGRVLSSSRGLGIRSSLRGRIGRIDNSRPLGGIRKRILTTAASVRSRELLRLKTSTSRMRSLALKKRSRTEKKADEAEEEQLDEEEEETTADKENGENISKEDVAADGVGGDEGALVEDGAAAENGKKNSVAVKKEEGTDATQAESNSKGGEGDGTDAPTKEEAEATDGKKKEKSGGDAASPAKKPSASKDGKTTSPIRYKSTFIKLACPHCPKAVTRTFKDYSRHLFSDPHRNNLQRVSLKLKHQLLKMRTAQRNAQRETDQGEDTETTRSAFCLLCRLNHRQTKAVHNASDGHKNMIRFQRPKCSICRIYFKAPFMYEQHRCTLEHIRNKARSDNLRTDDENSDGEVERDLENFTTVDSVGDVDDEDAGDLPEMAGKEEIEEEDINIGAEHVKKMEVYYCDLCRYYFPQEEERMVMHCQSRSHLRAYLQFKDDELLRQDAERLARKRKPVAKKAAATTAAPAEKIRKVEEGEAKESAAGAEGEKKKAENGEEAKVSEECKASKSEGEEKAAKQNGKDNPEDLDELELTATDEIAQDEDQDVSDLLDRSTYEDDEDSRINSERYDRFRYSGDKDNGEEEEEEAPATAVKEDSAV